MIAIYALSCIDCPDDIYIGSSNDVERRMGQHKCACNKVGNKKYNRKVYSFIRNNGGWEKWRYHIIEQFDVYDEKQLKEREDYWIMELKSSLNSCRVIHNAKEYREINRGKILEKRETYKKKHKDKLTARNYCECGSFYQYKSRYKHFRTKRCTEYMESIISI